MRIVLLFLFAFQLSNAQQLPLSITLLYEPDYITGDILGNIYTIKGSDIQKYNDKGILCCTYSDKTSGEITSVDVRDPLRILVFYKPFGIIKILDNKLGEQSIIELRKMQLTDPWMVCTSDIQGIWAYDNATSRLYRFDASMQPIGLSNDLRQDISRSLNPEMMAESDYWLIIKDNNSLLVFDKMGSYFKPVPIEKGTAGLLLHDEWIYTSGNRLYKLNIRTGKVSDIVLPADATNKKITILPGKIVYQEGKIVDIYNN